MVSGFDAALCVRGGPPPPTPPRKVPACGDSHPCPVGLSPHAGTLGRSGVTPLDPESPHVWGLRQNRAVSAPLACRPAVGNGTLRCTSSLCMLALRHTCEYMVSWLRNVLPIPVLILALRHTCEYMVSWLRNVPPIPVLINVTSYHKHCIAQSHQCSISNSIHTILFSD
jgi:hypothetical protein